MGALTETEIFDQMRTSFGFAIEAATDLARLPLKGHNYDKLRKNLRLIEGCCKQANTWREDTRWLTYIGLTSKCHQMAGEWLRGIKQEDGRRIKIAEGQLHPAFVMLADNLRAMQNAAEQMRTRATGRRGMILPDAQRAPHRDTRPVGYTGGLPMSAGGIILPSPEMVQ